MSSDPTTTSVATDLQDERLRQRQGVRGVVAVGLERIRGGDLGVLPVVLGLVIIWTIFQSLNSYFLSSANLVNLLMECSAVGVMALGIVCVLLVGEIDLSVGSISGFSAALVAVAFVKHDWPLPLAIVAAIAGGVLIGVIYSVIYNRFGVPSFVITLAGLLGFQGLQLFTLGHSGTINLPFDSILVKFGQLWFVPPTLSYGLVALAVLGFLAARISRAKSRVTAGLSATSRRSLLVQAAGLAALLLFATWYLNQSRGIGWMFVLFVTLVLALHYALTRTKWGLSVFAVGGNEEAARRAGVNVTRIYLSVFVLCATLAAVGGLLAAGRLAAGKSVV